MIVRGGALVAGMLALAACAGFSHSAPVQDKPPRASDIVELAWIAPGADRAAALLDRPAFCGTTYVYVGPDRQVVLGRLAFESPALLGGAAARGGISCASCHVNGRGNPNFFVNGVSGSPGTADVTSSLFSQTRGDGVFNPVAIPDLALRNGTQMRDRASPAFRDKVRGLVVEEFDGEAPPDAVFDALIAYLEALQPDACHSDHPQRSVSANVDRDHDAAQTAAMEAANTAASLEERLFWIRVARERLSRMHERLGDPADEALRSRLRRLSASLGAEADDLRAGRPVRDPQRTRWGDLQEAMREASARSFYDPDLLRAALADEQG